MAKINKRKIVKTVSKKKDAETEEINLVDSNIDNEDLNEDLNEGVDQDGIDYADEGNTPSDQEEPTDHEEKTEDDSINLASIEDGITLEEQPVEEQEKMAKVALKTDYKLNVGGTWYHFKAGVEKSIPIHVKQILLETDLVKAR